MIEKALVAQKIPAAAVGVVAGGQVVLLKGYGRRDLEGGKPMTPDTLLPIASVTKQLTVAALGTLVRQGKLEWDKPVRDYLPDFRVGDDYTTLHATPRDLVTHRIGLPRHDFAWFGSELSRQELYGRLPVARPAPLHPGRPAGDRLPAGHREPADRQRAPDARGLHRPRNCAAPGRPAAPRRADLRSASVPRHALLSAR